MLKVRLVAIGGSADGRRIRVEGDRFRIGRHESCDLRLKTSTVSRSHCVIVQDDERVMIQDLGSQNGTRINGKRLGAGQASRLWHDDHIQIGKGQFRLSIRDAVTRDPVKAPEADHSAIAQLPGLAAAKASEDVEVDCDRTKGENKASGTSSSLLSLDATDLLDELDTIAGVSDEQKSTRAHFTQSAERGDPRDIAAEQRKAEADHSDTVAVSGVKAGDEQSFRSKGPDATSASEETKASGDRSASNQGKQQERDPDAQEGRRYGSLPKQHRSKNPIDSQDAAEQALKRLFSG